MKIGYRKAKSKNMVAESKQAQKQLYETDYHLWVLETVKKLQNHEWEAIDWENLIEEISDSARRDKKKLKSLLKNLIEHLLKLKYWQAEITNFRQLIRDELEESPSLQPYLYEIYPQCYAEARKIASQRSQLPLNTFPESTIAPLEQVLDENWLP